VLVIGDSRVARNGDSPPALRLHSSGEVLRLS